MPGGIPAPVITPTSEIIAPETKVAIRCNAKDVEIYYTVSHSSIAERVSLCMCDRKRRLEKRERL
jgi:hypothetical protein